MWCLKPGVSFWGVFLRSRMCFLGWKGEVISAIYVIVNQMLTNDRADM